MSFLIIGLGSMGKRRIRDLLRLQNEKVIGWDLREDRRKAAENLYGIKTYPTLNEALTEDLHGIIISTPPDHHMEYAHLAADLNVPFFTEASVTIDGIPQLIEKLKTKTNLVAAPSCTMLFHSAVEKIQELLNENIVGEKYFFLLHTGQYLPDWHSYEDYRSFYVSNRDTGGCKEIVPYEWIWLTSLFGSITNWVGINEKISNLETEIDDVYHMILSFSKGVKGQITIDVISRIYTRTIEIIGEDGTIICDFLTPKLTFYSGTEKKEVQYDLLYNDRPFQSEDMYIREMNAFLNAISGQQAFPHTYQKDLALLQILHDLEKNSFDSIKEKG